MGSRSRGWRDGAVVTSPGRLPHHVRRPRVPFMTAPKIAELPKRAPHSSKATKRRSALMAKMWLWVGGAAAAAQAA